MYKVTLMLAASLSFSSRSTCIRIAFVSCVYARHRQRDGTGREREGVRQHMCVSFGIQNGETCSSLSATSASSRSICVFDDCVCVNI